MNTDAIMWQSAMNVFRSQKNLKKLYDSFDLIECRDADLTIECEYCDDGDGEFIQPVQNFFYSIKLSARKNAKTRGWLTIAIQLTCKDGMEAEPEWEFGRRAKVIVGYSPISDHECAWTFEFDSPDADGTSEDYTKTETHWEMAEEDGTSWFYAIPLDQLISSDAVRELIVTPVRAFLHGGLISQELMRIRERVCLPPNRGSV